MQLDIKWIRSQFPALSQEIDGKPVVFFDGPGGTQVPNATIAAISNYLIQSNANAHGAFATSARTDKIITSARIAIADFLGCDPDEVVFGANMTTLTFALSRAIGRELKPGDEIVVTRLDHEANVSPWLALQERGVVIRFVDVNLEDCTLDMSDLARQINERTRLVAIAYASNAVGTINDVTVAVKLARAVGALVFIDAVHYAPHSSLDVRSLDCDFLACSAYKFFAPHIGILYGKREHLSRLQPYKVRPAPDEIPSRWETGTQNHEGLAGLLATINYLNELGQRISPDVKNGRSALVTAMEAIAQYEKMLSKELITELLQIRGLKLYGIANPERFAWRTPTVAIQLAGYSPYEVAKMLGDRNIFTWNGNFYARHLTERLGIESSGGLVRIGLVHYNTVEEIYRLLKALEEIADGA
jgi:cysteine desulfurase family protein (TIGR01976 family)